MTSETQAPDQIWATYSDAFGYRNWEFGSITITEQPAEGRYVEYTRSDLVAAKDARIKELEAENQRLLYVLGGVAAAIDTGRNEPLVIWREQIDIARAALSREGE